MAMANYEFRQKVFTSAPVLFILYAVPFGVFLQFTRPANNYHSFSIVNAGFVGIPFGIMMTLATKRRLQKFNKTTGLSEKKQQWAVHDAVRTGVLPTDPTILKVMPKYIEKRIKQNQQSKKYTTPLLLLFLAGSSLIAFTTHTILLGIFSLIYPIIAILNYFTTKQQTEKLESLKAQLIPK